MPLIRNNYDKVLSDIFGFTMETPWYGLKLFSLKLSIGLIFMVIFLVLYYVSAFCRFRFTKIDKPNKPTNSHSGQGIEAISTPPPTKCLFSGKKASK